MKKSMKLNQGLMQESCEFFLADIDIYIIFYLTTQFIGMKIRVYS